MIGAMLAYRPLYMVKRKIHNAVVPLVMSVNSSRRRSGRLLAGILF